MAFAGAAADGQSLDRNGRIPRDLNITLERTMCFGTCPQYMLTISADGRVKFDGQQFTNVKGSANGRISRTKVRSLVRRFAAARFFKLKDSYEREPYCGGIITDLPSENVTIRISGRKKSVHHYFGCHGKQVQGEIRRLNELAKYIDRITNSKRWVASKVIPQP